MNISFKGERLLRQDNLQQLHGILMKEFFSNKRARLRQVFHRNQLKSFSFSNDKVRSSDLDYPRSCLLDLTADVLAMVVRSPSTNRTCCSLTKDNIPSVRILALINQIRSREKSRRPPIYGRNFLAFLSRNHQIQISFFYGELICWIHF